jgi:hypothetical protein
MAVTRPALTVRQPYAALILAGVKRYETRSRPCPAKYVGVPIALHAGASLASLVDGRQFGPFQVYRQADGPRLLDARERPPVTDRWVETPLGVIVGSVTFGPSIPIIGESDALLADWPYVKVGDRSGLVICDLDDTLYDNEHDGVPVTQTVIDDQLPFGHWVPGGWAWPVLEATPSSVRCPYGCRRLPGYAGLGPDGPEHAYVVDVYRSGVYCALEKCPACDGRGSCAPIRARGRLGFWGWSA